MEQFIATFFSGLSTQFYIYQVIAIMLLVIYGLAFMSIIRGEKISKFDMLLAYPVSLVIYSLAGLLILSLGIPFGRLSQIVMMVLIIIVMALQFKCNIKNIRINKSIFVFLVVAFALALISTSGIFKVSVLNDSMYYFSEYPRALVFHGKLIPQLDHFMTDAAQGIAVIGTIPALFGFDEFFGIQTLLNINFVCFFAISVYDYARKNIDNNKAMIMTALSVIVLLTSMPFVIMAKWIMANTFFMEYMLITCVAAHKYSMDSSKPDLIIASTLLTGLSIMRIEGALYAGVIVLCIMMLDYKNADIVKYFLCPMTVLQALYLTRIFVLMTLHSYAQFMTKGKAVILIAFLLAIIMYVLIVRDRFFVKYKKYYPAIIVLGLVAINLLALAYRSDRYIANIRTFIANLLRSSGWGLFVPFVIGVFILIPKKSIRINFFDVTVVCYILVAILAGWARGDLLVESFGDSGNRVLIQVVPILLYALCIKIVEGMKLATVDGN